MRSTNRAVLQTPRWMPARTVSMPCASADGSSRQPSTGTDSRSTNTSGGGGSSVAIAASGTQASTRTVSGDQRLAAIFRTDALVRSASK